MKIKLHAKLSLYFLVIIALSAIFIKSFWLLAAFLFLALHLIIYFSVTRPLSRFSKWVSDILHGSREEFKPVIFSRDEIGELGALLRGLVERDEQNSSRTLSQTIQIDAVLSGMDEGVIVTDKHSQILLMNPSARKMFYIDGDFYGKKIYELFFNSAVMQSADAVLQGKARQVSCEVVFNNSEKTMQLLTGVLERGGDIEGAVFVFHDISELKRLEEVRKEFVANVSHELRTPLAAIKGFASSLLQKDIQFDDETRLSFIQTIDSEADRLGHMIEDLLLMSKIEAGVYKARKEIYDMEEIIGTIKDRMYNIALKHHLKIDLPDRLPPILVDGPRIGEVITNLVENAVKYSPEESEIAISFELKEKELITHVRDHGAGIPAEYLPMVFDRFNQLRMKNGHRKGSGLGLCICRGIIESHGGRIWVQSETGQGACFSFSLPICQSA